MIYTTFILLNTLAGQIEFMNFVISVSVYTVDEISLHFRTAESRRFFLSFNQYRTCVSYLVFVANLYTLCELLTDGRKVGEKLFSANCGSKIKLKLFCPIMVLREILIPQL